VDGIIHTASPVTTKADLPEEVIKPAVAGTLGILKSSLKFACVGFLLPGAHCIVDDNNSTFRNRLNRFILTSSTGAIYTPVTQPTILDETDWNDLAVEEVERLGRGAEPMSKYETSKVLAERGVYFHQLFSSNSEAESILTYQRFGNSLKHIKMRSDGMSVLSIPRMYVALLLFC
jgi:nucleoside-diphosphate-sugar epimerase